MYATISSIKKMREIIYFETFMDWCAILLYYYIDGHESKPAICRFWKLIFFFLNRKVRHFANAYSILKCII